MAMRYLKNVTTLQLDSDKCTGCGVCLTVCPHEVFKMQAKKAVIQDKNKCMECGACAKNCAFDALTVRAGVGCATAVLVGLVKRTEPQCGCQTESSCC
ncbi:4Fe-4S binding protein [candidate division KSB1 bacterium]|nr:4Fe-4S binding protein [candidate division KSB1 bacterium]